MGVPAAAACLLSLPEAGEHGLDDPLEREAAGHVQLGGEAELGVDDTVGGEVERALAGDPGQLLLRLHHGDGVREGLQVALERAGVGGVDGTSGRARRRRWVGRAR